MDELLADLLQEARSEEWPGDRHSLVLLTLRDWRVSLFSIFDARNGASTVGGI